MPRCQCPRLSAGLVTAIVAVVAVGEGEVMRAGIWRGRFGVLVVSSSRLVLLELLVLGFARHGLL